MLSGGRPWATEMQAPRRAPESVAATLIGRASVKGSIEPRLWTPPLRELTPETSLGFDQIEYATLLGRPPDPWQRWLLIHAGELLTDGRPRFRIVIVMAARQNGKTWTPVTLSSYWQFVERVPLILGTSTKLDYARESWLKATEVALNHPLLEPDLPPTRNRGIRLSNGEQEMRTKYGSRYKIAASNAEGGRSLTVSRAILDELRQHYHYDAWNAIIPAMNAVMDAQAWCLSNAGTDRSVVLNDQRAAALHFVEHAQGDPRTAIFEWSAPSDASPLDPEALAMANPNLGRRLPSDVLLGQAEAAVARGGDALAGFLTESMCIRVANDSPPALPSVNWGHCRDEKSERLGRHLVLGLDISPDRSTSAITMAAPREDGLPMIKVVRHGPGTDWVMQHVLELWRTHRPAGVALDRVGPAHSYAHDLEKRGVTILPMSAGDMADACGNIYDMVVTEQLRTCGQAELDAAAAVAVKRPLGDRWAFARSSPGADITPLVAGTAALWGLSRSSSAPPSVH